MIFYVGSPGIGGRDGEIPGDLSLLDLFKALIICTIIECPDLCHGQLN